MPPAPPMPPPKPSGSISMDARASCSAWGQGREGAFGQGVGSRPPTAFGSSSQIHIDGVPASFASATRRATPGRSTPSVHRAAFVVTNKSSSGRSWLRSIVGLFGLRFFLRKSFRKWTRRGLKLRLLVHATRSRMCDRIADLLVSLQTRRQRVRASNTSTARQESTRFCDLFPRVPQKHSQSAGWSAQKRVCAGFASRPSLWIYGFM